MATNVNDTTTNSLNNSSIHDVGHVNMSVDCAFLLFRIDEYRYAFHNRAWLGSLITALYAVIATTGALGNLLVILAVLRRPQMRTPRNYFVMNLALSDFTMCTVTVPFTVMMLTDMFWVMGDILCRAVASLQGINVFVSTLSITAISLDRYLLIIFPTNPRLHKVAPIICLLIVWLWSLLMASPMVFFTHIKYPLENVESAQICGFVDKFPMCREQFPRQVYRISYSLACFAFQYALPLATLAFVYSSISLRLRARLTLRAGATAPARETKRDTRTTLEQQRQNRANKLIICIVIIFALVWLPLNVYLTVVNVQESLDKPERFAFCHMVGMISACANPILYGVLNENFKREFASMLRLRRFVKFFGTTDTNMPTSRIDYSIAPSHTPSFHEKLSRAADKRSAHGIRTTLQVPEAKSLLFNSKSADENSTVHENNGEVPGNLQFSEETLL